MITLLTKRPHEVKVVVGIAKKENYVVDNILYYEGAEVCDHQCVVVPIQKLLDEHHDLPFARRFADKKLVLQIRQLYYRQD